MAITQDIINQIPGVVNESTPNISADRTAGYDEGGNIPIKGYGGVFNIGGKEYIASYDDQGKLNDISSRSGDMVDRYVPGYGSFSQPIASEKSGDFLGSILSNPAAQIALAYYMPGLGAKLGVQLGVNATVGTALVSTAVQVASGVDFDTAVKNATVTAVINSGSPEVAKEINNQLQQPGVSNALTSVGASIVKTGALGGSVDDMIKNAGAALAGSVAETSVKGPDVSPETSKAIGSAVGGSITGGVMGAALGAAGALGQPTPAPTPEAPPAPTPEAPPAPTPEAPPAPPTPAKVDISGFTEVPVNDMTAGVQVAGPGGFEEFKPGINQTKMGTYFTGFNAQGALNTVPVIIDSATGQIVSATGTPEDVGFLRLQNVSVLRVDTSKINPVYLDKTPINPNLTPEELNALKEITFAKETPSPEAEFAAKYPDLAKLLKTYGSLDVAETAIGLDALMKIPGVQEAMNASYLRELEAGLAKDPTYSPYLEEYKKITGRDYSPTSAGIPTSDFGTVKIVGEKLKDVTQPFTPSVISPDSSIVIDVDPKTGKALVMDSKGKVTVVDAGADIKKDQYVTVDPTTQTATATKTYPTVIAGTSTAVAPGSEPLIKGQTKTDVAISDQPQTKTQTVTKPTGENVYGGVGSGGGGGPAAPVTPEPFVGGITDKPSTTDKPVDKTDTTKELPPVEDRTGKSTYIPELFIYSGKYPGGLGQALGVQGSTTPTPTTGLTSYRGAGEIEVGPGIERQNVWNEASLRLKDALGV